MCFMVKVYGGFKPQPGQKGTIIERDVSLAAKTVGSDSFLFPYKTLKSVMEDLPSHSICCKSYWMHLRGTRFDLLMVFEEQVSTRERWMSI